MNIEKTDGPVSIIFDIQRFSIHDGPGIRTLIFFKGCSLQCAWCQNPESIKMKPEIAFYAERCIGCGSCLEVCIEGAVSMVNSRRVNWEKCTACGLCTMECPSDALRLVGTEYSVHDLVQESLRDKDFYDVSSGGISLSGGEPVLQSKFLMSFLPELKKHNIHILLETAGNYPFSKLEPLLPYLDHIYFDYKLPDDQAYLNHTGAGNQQVLEILTILMEKSFPLTVRVPVVPGMNTESNQVKMISETLLALGLKDTILLKYNPLWESKIPRLNTRQKALHFSIDTVDYEKVIHYFSKNKFKATLSE